MNSTGKLFRITTFGESHGPALGVVIDGLPANFHIDQENIRQELARRKPGQSNITTQRKEDDENFEILSGVFEGKSTGHPIAIIVRNTGEKSGDYENIKNLFRPNHADLTYQLKYGIRDHRGGGRSSGRETLSRVIAGAIAKQYLKEKLNLEIKAFVKQIGKIKAEKINYDFIENNLLRTADENKYDEMLKFLEKIKSDPEGLGAGGDSVGGIIECHVNNTRAGLGEPVFDKIKSRLANSMLSIGGVIGFEYGKGFGIVEETGESYNEGFQQSEGKIFSEHNNYGGILGGISTGEQIVFHIAVKPTSSIYKAQKTVDINGNEVDFQIQGRHDACILPRVVPVVESMVAIDLLDLYLIDKSRK